MPPDRLILFTRYPEPGKTKTRLISTLGPEGAAALHSRMAIHTLANARRLARRRPVGIEVRFAGGDIRRMRRWLGGDFRLRMQGTGHLGERMHEAFRTAFAEGAGRVLVIGTDCPGISVALLYKAFETIRHHDLVLGPATDGGYYLIGLRRPIAELFPALEWGTDSVLSDTLRIARSRGLSVSLFHRLTDVDRPGDLPAWEAVAREEAWGAGGPNVSLADSPSVATAAGPIPQATRPLSPRQGEIRPRVSVIVPTLNEVRYIGLTLSTLEPRAAIEVIVVDGGSSDGTKEVARGLGARVIETASGRAEQMNAGAAVARGDTLLFLHGDTMLPRWFDDKIVATLARPGTAAGAFSLRIAGSLRSLALRLVEFGANWRAQRLQLPYGDQALFVRASTFRNLHGFPAVPILEDRMLVRRLCRIGRVVTLKSPVVTSARRWNRAGVLRLTLWHQLILIGHSLGVPLDWLARWRPAGKPPGGGTHPSAKP